MKKIIFALVAVLALTSCENLTTRKYGNDMIIEVPGGYKVTNAGWDNSVLYYMTEPMDSDYTPKTKVMYSKSTFASGSVKFIESK